MITLFTKLRASSLHPAVPKKLSRQGLVTFTSSVSLSLITASAINMQAFLMEVREDGKPIKQAMQMWLFLVHFPAFKSLKSNVSRCLERKQIEFQSLLALMA